MPTPDNARLAVLIDADNTSPRHASALLEEVARYGVPTVKRAYGDWTTQQLVGWKDELHRNAIHPVQQFAYTTGKNSTDSALIIDAMDLLYTGNLDAFAVVSSDSDFTRLVTRLRESGKTVYGFGRRRTPESLVAACDKFVFLEVLGRQPERSGDSADPSPDAEAGGDGGPGGEAAPLPDLRTIITSAVDATSGDDGWALLAAVGGYLGTRHASFDPRNYGYGKLIVLARAQDYLDVDQGNDAAPRVRIRESATRTARKTSQKSGQQKATKKAGSGGSRRSSGS